MCNYGDATAENPKHVDVGDTRVSIGERYVTLLEWVPEFQDDFRDAFSGSPSYKLVYRMAIPREDAIKICKVVLANRHTAPIVDPSIA